ncbi:uncharacterized protein [Ptychodera flava]|uniref:uncharacterized protein n=1 Tax=Ptychodera flava TaxID=63121 RepID=UPI00396AA7DF
MDDSRDVMSKRLKYLRSCRENVRKRWLNEYLHALQERYSKRIEAKHQELPRKNSIVLLKDTTKNRANWRIGRIVDDIVGKDGVIRGYKIRTGSGYVVERPLQLVCDLEVSGTNDATGVGDIADPVINQTRTSADEEERSQANQELRRPARRAKTAAVDRLVGVIANENEDD